MDDNFEYKYKKYKCKYITKKNLYGGAKDKNDENKERKHGDKEYVFKVKCVQVFQDDENYKFDGKICRTPPIRMRFYDKEVGWALIIKSLLRFVNKSLHMKFIKNVVIKMGKEKPISLEGSQLVGKVDLSKEPEYEEIIINF